MDLADLEITKTIFELLPGFVTAWIFYGLTAHPRPSQFERTIQALIFTVFTKILVNGIRVFLQAAYPCVSFGAWSDNVELVWNIITAVFIGLIFTWFANNNKLHSWLWGRLTTRTSYPSEWFSTFWQLKRYVYLHLTSGRRLYGWPEEWPDEPGKGHFRLAQAEWILDDNTRIPLHASEGVLVAASDVELVEFQKHEKDLWPLADDIDEAASRMIRHNSIGKESDQKEEPNDSRTKSPTRRSQRAARPKRSGSSSR